MCMGVWAGGTFSSCVIHHIGPGDHCANFAEGGDTPLLAS